jgi:hypothetical protein
MDSGKQPFFLGGAPFYSGGIDASLFARISNRCTRRVRRRWRSTALHAAAETIAALVPTFGTPTRR